MSNSMAWAIIYHTTLITYTPRLTPTYRGSFHDQTGLLLSNVLFTCKIFFPRGGGGCAPLGTPCRGLVGPWTPSIEIVTSINFRPHYYGVPNWTQNILEDISFDYSFLSNMSYITLQRWMLLLKWLQTRVNFCVDIVLLYLTISNILILWELESWVIL